jgi:hypothetical protein
MAARPTLRLLAAGALVGTVVLGAGGRLAMAAIQAASGTTPPRFTLGGSLTVVGLGAASGIFGAAIAAGCRWVARWLPRRVAWLEHALLAALLLAVTLRGLRGTAVLGHAYFVPLVAVYAALMLWLDRRWAARPAPLAAG